MMDSSSINIGPIHSYQEITMIKASELLKDCIAHNEMKNYFHL